MKIAVIKKDYDILRGGAERYAVEACTRLAARGHRLTVFSETFNAPEMRGIEWNAVPKAYLSAFSRTAAFHRMIQSGNFDFEGYDVTYALSRTYPCDVFRIAESVEAEWIGKRYSALQKLNPRHRGILKLEKRMYSPGRVGHVVTNAELTRKHIVSRYSYPEERITVIRNGVNIKQFFPAEYPGEKDELRGKLGLGKNDFIFMFAAANFRSKGLEHAIRAFTRLGQDFLSKSKLIVLGSYRPDEFMALAKRLGVGGKLLFQGRRTDIRDFYVASDIFLYPTIYEPCANVCLEACACGLPVITTSFNGASEIIENGVNGYVVPECADYDLMVENIRRFSDLDGGEKKSFSEKAVEASRQCDWETHVDILESVLQKTAVI